MTKRQVLLLSNSKLYGQEFFEWCSDFLCSFLLNNKVSKLLFIPYAVRDHDGYLKKVEGPLNKLGFQVESIHNKSNPVAAIEECQGIFVGGGNTFLLLKTLYEQNLMEPIRKAVFQRNVPYIGSSAGTNVATRSINTTNDMPICWPPSLEALRLVPFNINPHFIEADPSSKHMGETREDRIKEYLNEPESAPVLGLKEGSALLVLDDKATLISSNQIAKLFEKNKEPVEYKSGDDLSFLLSIES